MLTGAAPRLYYDAVTGDWRLVIEATMFVTGATVNVWTGRKPAATIPPANTPAKPVATPPRR